MDSGFPTVVWCLCFGPGCVWARVSAAPRHSWLGCRGVCVFVSALCLCPATAGWGVRRGCVCLGSGFGRAPPLLAGVLGMCVFVCSLRLYPATPGRGVRRGCVCLGSSFGGAPPLLAGLLGCVCVCVLVPRHSWLGCVVWVCVWARALAVPRHSWLQCWGVCVFLCLFRLYPATPGWGGRRGCVCLGFGFGCAPPLLAGMLGGVCVCVTAPLVPSHSSVGCVVCVCVFGLELWLRPATPDPGVVVCVCSCARSACTPPFLAGALGCVCVFVPAPLVPRRSWLGCAVLVFLLGPGFRLRPTTPGLAVRVCVCLCARPACSPPLLAGPCGVGVFAWAWVSASPRHSWLGC